MDLKRETIQTEGRKPLLDAFQLVGISNNNIFKADKLFEDHCDYGNENIISVFNDNN
jgi:hypothetical protein